MCKPLGTVFGTPMKGDFCIFDRPIRMDVIEVTRCKVKKQHRTCLLSSSHDTKQYLVIFKRQDIVLHRISKHCQVSWTALNDDGRGEFWRNWAKKESWWDSTSIVWVGDGNWQRVQTFVTQALRERLEQNETLADWITLDIPPIVIFFWQLLPFASSRTFLRNLKWRREKLGRTPTKKYISTVN